MKKKIILIEVLLILLLFTTTTAAFFEQGLKKLNYQIVADYQHDPQAFTQGLEIYNGFLYEGTGLYGRSSLRKINLETAEILKKINLDKKYFGEGITILDNKIYQLSWKENTVLIYDLNFNLLKKLNYKGEGWGLTNDGRNLIMSNGSPYIYFRNPDTFEVLKKIKIKTNKKEIKNINELEYQQNFIYANIWQTDYIIKINAQNGRVEAYLDLSNILKTSYQGEIDVLNGIAYDPQQNNFLVTGKLWPKIYRIKIKNPF